jgi:hypothetical protein
MVVIEDQVDEAKAEEEHADAGATEIMLSRNSISSLDFGDSPSGLPPPVTPLSNIGELGMTKVQIRKRTSSPKPRSQNHLSTDYRPRSPTLAPKSNSLSPPEAGTSNIGPAAKTLSFSSEGPLVSYQPIATIPKEEAPETSPIKRLVRVFSLGREPAIETKPEDEIEDVILIFKEDKSIELLNWRRADEDCKYTVLGLTPPPKYLTANLFNRIL